MGRMPESDHRGGGALLAAQLVKDLIDAGIHFGHRASHWNPKMKPYILGKRNLIHIINVKETIKGLLVARKFLTRIAADGKDVLVVGTKRQARKAVEEHAARAGMHWVSDRWLGGTLTNFREIRKRVGRLDQLEQMEADGTLDAYSKKQGASLRRQMRKIKRNLGGIRNMTRLPGAMIVIDQKREIIAIKEANKLNIPVVCLLDTECDPDMVDIPIPGNDDAMRAIELIVKELCDAILEGVHARGEVTEEPAAPPKRRSRRPTTARAEAAEQTSPEDEAAEAPEAPQAGPLAPQSEGRNPEPPPDASAAESPAGGTGQV